MTQAVLVIIMSGLSFIGVVQENLQQQEKLSVKVNIDNIGSDEGNLYYMIFNSEENFNNRTPLKSSLSKVKNGQTSVEFDGLRKGSYAVLCFYDQKENGQMDFTENGIPLEKYGLTNNTFNYGSPSFSDAKFDINEASLTFEIELIQVL